jgi:hypothetical protein
MYKYKEEDDDEEKPWVLGRLRQAASSRSRMSIPYPLYHNIIIVMIVCRGGVGVGPLRRECCCVAAVEVFIAEVFMILRRERRVHRQFIAH